MNNNSFWKFTFVYACGFLLLRGISFFLLPLYTNLLSTDQAGIVFLIYTLLAFLNPVYAYGMNAALFQFYNKDDCDKRTVLSTSFISLFFTSLLFSFFLYLFSGFLNNIIVDSPEFNSYNWFLLIAVILFFDSLSSRVFVVIRLLEKPKQFLLAGMLNIVLSLFFNYYFIGILGLESFGAILAIVLVSISQALVLSMLVFNYIKYGSFDFSLFKKMVSFALPFLPSALLFVIIGFSDRWFIKYYLTLHDVGLYGAGYKLGSIMSLIITGFSLNWQPYFLKKGHNDDNEFGKIGSLVIVCLMIVLTLLSVGAYNLVQLNWNQHYLIGKEFWGSVSIIPVVALGYFFYGIYLLQMPAIFIKNKQNWSVLFWLIGAITNILGNIILIPMFGILGAAISTVISYFIMMVLIIIKNKNWLPIKYSLSYLVIHLIISVVVVLSCNYLNLGDLVFFKLLFILLYLLASLYILKSINSFNFLFQNE